ncbi:protein NRT1/ PTR FAMILY 5.6-like [Canna indica]|uniref:Protein NRT1/ PTR FAMILY 5.6-like n=1 Tax=Canna indica TaxID=4628 RepID=A0AAQ3KE96_9LILI|nr:protein NRT1/ PTR FAMILY 5.6-like [Canna indica]
MDSVRVDKVENKSEDDDDTWVFDSSVDYKGRVPRRASTGSWKAALFIIVIEFGERLSYFGLAPNLIIYLTKVLHQELKTAAKNVNYWGGVTMMMPLVGGFIADAYLGRFSTVFVSSLIYITGLALLTISQVVPRLKPCDDGDNASTCDHTLRLHEVIFFLAIYLISAGTGGHKPALESFGADQFDDNHAAERKRKMSYFNWWNFALCSGVLLGVTVITYLHDVVGWWPADVVLTSVLCLSLVVFVAGRPFYRYRAPEGSPFTPMLQVVAAAVAKRRLPVPSDAAELYEAPEMKHADKRLLCRTNKLRFLDRAAVIEHKEDEDAFATEKLNPWRLATITQVEELKLILGMMPIWLSALPFAICLAQGSTFFIKQASIANRKIGGGFEIPSASVFALGAVGMIITVTLYDKILEPLLRRATGRERGISILQRIGIGLAFSVAAMAAAALVERKRLAEADAGMSVLWLMPQYLILGFGDGFALVGLQEYFYEQVPDGMRSSGIAFYFSTHGVASFLSSFLITAVDRVTSRGAKGSWFAKELNESRLDLFYWLLAALSGVNLCCYVYWARRYSYKRVQRKVAVVDSPEAEADV